MTSLVTVFGGSGFLGRYVVRALARAGHRIRVGVRQPNLANFLPPMGHVGQIQLVRADVTDADALARAMRGADAAINLVGILYESGRQRFESVHAGAAGKIGAAARAQGVSSLVHISAIGASPDSPSLYARSKAQGEARLREAFSTAAILRPSIIFGPEDDFFNRFAALARLSPALPLIGGGHTRFQPAYVCDVAEAVARCVADEQTRGVTYELGGPTVYTFKQLIELVLAETNRRRLLIPIPFPLAMLKASLLELLPKPLLTRDQVRLLQQDNVVSPGARGFADLGIEPDAVESIIPSYLWRFRSEGQFEPPPREPLNASR
ncbi:MAG TPA: complex I NDUFA9 subunit family protein [Rhizomicrobium sp.]|jgi:NADH dehydrogenase|nr:complex I NDUFA9 subunit family protein [Rhizomicrobium sp.]